MIGALIDPNGKHYQGTLFLEKFIDIIGLNDFGLNLENTTVGVEYKDIDLYITDGTKHIIIENKIWAEDQPCQIMKYINIIVEENKNDFNNPQENDILDEDLLRVIYLTPRDKEISAEHKISDGYIEYKDGSQSLKKCSDKMRSSKIIDFDLKNYRAKYKKISYKKEILLWLTKSHNEIRNITNLSESVKQYIAVVEKVNKNYKGNVMTLENYMDEHEEMYEHLEELTKIENSIEPKFWNELLSLLREKAFLGESYHIEYKKKSDFKNKPEIRMVSKLNKDKFIYIRRDHNTFFGFSSPDKSEELSSYFGREDNQCWKHTNPKIDFHKHNEEFWKIAKPSARQEVIKDIVTQVEELIKKVDELSLI